MSESVLKRKEEILASFSNGIKNHSLNVEIVDDTHLKVEFKSSQKACIGDKDVYPITRSKIFHINDSVNAFEV